MRATRRLATTIISWAAIAAAEPRVRVALQVSGHLRELCESNATAGLDNFAPLEALVASCREHADCDVFVHTWSTLDASTPTWHTPRPPDPRPSAPCAARLARLRPAAVAVDEQPRSALANRTWWRGGRWGDSLVSVAGVLAAVRATRLAAQLRADFEGAAEGATAAPYDVAVRLRPDIYPRDRGNMRTVRVKAVDNASWAVPVRAARRADRMPVVRGCDSECRPGIKSCDMCFWAAPPSTLDKLLARWDDIAEAGVRNNLCWQDWRARNPDKAEAERRQDWRAALAGGAPCEMRPGRDGLPEGLLENALGQAGLESRRLKEPCC